MCDLRCLFSEESKEISVSSLNLNDLFPEENQTSTLNFVDDHFSRDLIEENADKERDIFIKVNVPIANDFDLLTVVSDAVPVPSVERGILRIFGKSKIKPHIKTTPRINADSTTIMQKLFKQKELKPSEIANLTSKGDRPIFNKTPPVSNKRISNTKKFLSEKTTKTDDAITKTRDCPTTVNGDGINTTHESDNDTHIQDGDTKPIGGAALDDFIRELPHRTKLLDDDRKLVVKNETLRRKTHVLKHRVVDDYIVRKTNMYINLLDYTTNLDTLKNFLQRISDSEKILHVDLTFIKDKTMVLSRVDNFKSLISESFRGLINIIVAKEIEIDIVVGEMKPKNSDNINSFWKPMNNSAYPIKEHAPKFINELTPVDSAINASIEIRELWSTTINTATATYREAYRRLSIPLGFEVRRYLMSHKEKFSVYDRL